MKSVTVYLTISCGKLGIASRILYIFSVLPRDMFFHINKKGMEVVMYFLFSKLNSHLAYEEFRYAIWLLCASRNRCMIAFVCSLLDGTCVQGYNVLFQLKLTCGVEEL